MWSELFASSFYDHKGKERRFNRANKQSAL